MAGFNAPRIVGQGQIQSPTVLKENAFGVLGDNIEMQRDKKEDKRRWEEKLRESNRRYDTDRFDRAQDRNLMNKWRLQQHKNSRFQVWERMNPTYPELDENGNPHPKANQEIPYDEWYQDTHPDIQSQLSKQQDEQDYDTWQQAHGVTRNPYVQNANVVNPFTGVIDKIGYGEGQWAPGKLLAKGAGALWDMTGIGQQEGNYIPGNETGDKNPAMLEDGEYVLNRNAVKGLGKGFLDYINDEAYPRFQSGGFNQGVAGGTAQVQGPEVLEENAFSSMADTRMEMQKMIMEAAMKATAGGASGGAGGGGGSGFDPTMFMAQEGGYMKPKGYRYGGSVDPRENQPIVYKHQRERFQRERDDDVREGHRLRSDNQEISDANVEAAIAELQNDWRFTLPLAKKNAWYNPATWFAPSEEEVYDEIRRNAPRYNPKSYLKSDYARGASQDLRERIAGTTNYGSTGSLESDFDNIKE
jgi:hypothetical protein